MKSLQRLLEYSKQYKFKIFLSLVSASIYGVAAATPTYLIKHMVDDIFVQRMSHLIVPFIFLFIFFFALKGLFMFLSSYLMHWVGNKVVLDIRKDLFEKVIYYPLSFFNQVTTGKLMSHFLHDVQMIQMAASSAIKNGVRSFFEALFLLSFAFIQNWKLALLMFVVGPAIAITIQKMGAKIKIASRGIQKEMGKISAMLQETFVGIRDVKAFSGEKIEGSRFGDQLKKCFIPIIANARIESSLPALIEVISMAGGSIAFYVATRQVLAGTISPGQLASFFAAVLLCYQPLKRMVGVYSEVQYALSAAERIFDLMDRVHPTLQSRNQTLEYFSGAIEFNNISFGYNENNLIFTNVSMSVKKGECIGIIGPSGVGKSTLCDLLLGFLQPTSGSILIGGKDITHISFESLRNKIGYVSQRTFLFNDSVKRNVAYSIPHATQDMVIAACKAAHAHEFIQHIPGKYDALVGENGALLSGGQKQRLTIARALLKDPDILIFDEPTSSLDHESEQIIQDAIAELAKKKTLFIVSHRPSLLKNADRVLKIENGIIQEVG